MEIGVIAPVFVLFIHSLDIFSRILRWFFCCSISLFSSFHSFLNHYCTLVWYRYMVIRDVMMNGDNDRWWRHFCFSIFMVLYMWLFGALLPSCSTCFVDARFALEGGGQTGVWTILLHYVLRWLRCANVVLVIFTCVASYCAVPFSFVVFTHWRFYPFTLLLCQIYVSAFYTLRTWCTPVLYHFSARVSLPSSYYNSHFIATFLFW